MKNISKKQLIAVFISIFAGSEYASAATYKVAMDNLENIAAGYFIGDDVGDLYDTSGVKQVDVAYSLREGFGETLMASDTVYFWGSPEYGEGHGALYANNGGVEVLEVELSGLNGNLVDLSQVTMGRWLPASVNSSVTDWKLYDGSWNLLFESSSLIEVGQDYVFDLDLGGLETVRFQMGNDNYNNGLTSFAFETDVNGILDLSIDGLDAATPDIPGSTPAPVPLPGAAFLFFFSFASLLGLRKFKRS